MALLVWGGLSMLANLWMLVLWMVAAALWAGAKTISRDSLVVQSMVLAHALVTMMILLGPAIEDSANGKDVYKASAIRVSLFIALSLYAWATVWLFQRWRASRSKAVVYTYI